MAKVNVVAEVVEALAAVGVDARESDDAVVVHAGGKDFRYQVEVRQGIRRELIGSLVLAASTKPGNRLLITDYVTPPIAEELRRQGVQFADAAGNAFLKRGGMLVIVNGRRSRRGGAMVRPLRVFRPSGIKTIFAILSVPELVEAPQREIAGAAGVALGSVAKVIEGLRELGFIAETDGTRRLLRTERLVDQWTEAYVRLLLPTLTLGRFAEPERNWWRHVDPAPYGAQWGGETAAALLHRQLVPEQTILYAEKLPTRMWTRYRLKADAEGRVILRRRFWNFDVPAARPDLVPPLLIYADLVAAGDARSLEAARRVRDERLV